MNDDKVPAGTAVFVVAALALALWGVVLGGAWALVHAAGWALVLGALLWLYSDKET